MTLREALVRARHDVAKYASMTARNLPAPPWEARLVAAVATDVLRTDGRRPVWEVWRDHRVALAPIEDRLGEIDRLVAAIHDRQDALRAEGAPGVDAGLVADLVSLQRAFRDVEAGLER